MRLQLIYSKTTWRNEGDGRLTSLWTDNRSPSPMAARFEKTLVINYLLKMHGLGAAAPGELPGELEVGLLMNIFISPAVAVCMPVVFLAVVTPLLDIRRTADRTMLYIGSRIYIS